MAFKDKDIKTAQAIFKDQETKPDHVDYEFRIWKGKLLLSGKENNVSFSLMVRRDSSRFRRAAEFEGA
jgi:hypothetical protein